MRGVSAIISIILIVVIVVSLVSVIYIFSSSIFTSTTSAAEKSISKTTTGLFSNMKIESILKNEIYLRNIGQTTLSNFTVYVNDVAATIVSAPTTVPPGQIATIKLEYIPSGAIKIFSAEGSTASFTQAPIDKIAPYWVYMDIYPISPPIGGDVWAISQWRDNMGLGKYIFSWNTSGPDCNSWQNETPLSFTDPNGYTEDKYRFVPCTCGGGKTIGVRFFATDTSNNQNATDIKTFTTTGVSGEISTYNSTLGAPECITGNAPCEVLGCEIGCSGNQAPSGEPNQPNTIDACTDGTVSGTCFVEASIKNIELTESSNDVFNKGDTTSSYGANFHCNSTSDYIRVYYTNNIVTPAWVLLRDDHCGSSGFFGLGGLFTIDNVEGRHAIRVIIKRGTISSPCDTVDYIDVDDIVFRVV